MTTPAEPATALNITDIVRGPIPPRVTNASWPNMLHTRIGDVVAEMGPPPFTTTSRANNAATPTTGRAPSGDRLTRPPT